MLVAGALASEPSRTRFAFEVGYEMPRHSAMIIAGLPSGWEGFEASAALKVIVRRHNEGASNTIKLAKMMSFVEALYFEVGMMNGGVTDETTGL